jgi:hypothetical protein
MRHPQYVVQLYGVPHGILRIFINRTVMCFKFFATDSEQSILAQAHQVRPSTPSTQYYRRGSKMLFKQD